MLELDVLLVPFVREVVPTLSGADQALYSRLLESEDQDLFACCMRRESLEDAELQRIVMMILEHARA